MKERFYRSVIELTNGRWSSHLLKKFATSTFSKKCIQSYSKVYGIHMDEVSKQPQQFEHLQDFFIRQLKQEVRPLCVDEKAVVSPVDGTVETFGQITADAVFTVKNKPYSIIDLLGKEQLAERYIDGHYIIFYLSPANYHRIHSPFNGIVERQYILGRKSYPVNQLGLTYGKKPLSHNYRLVSEVTFGHDAHAVLIKVGATFVNSIELTNTTTSWEKGEEIGYFSFGSTVVMLFEKDTITWTEHLQEKQLIRMGEAFANML